MPDMNGVEALKEIKKISPTAKVVMITADLTVSLEKLLQHNGASAVIFKPFDVEKIMSLLEQIKISDSIVIQR
jgi:DNA-binding NtrC family response regulator